MHGRFFVLLVMALLLIMGAILRLVGPERGQTDKSRLGIAEMPSGRVSEKSSADAINASAATLARDRAEFSRDLSRLQTSLGSIERAALSQNRARLLETARVLRDLLIEKPDLVSEAAGILADGETGVALRRVLSVVLGSLPGREGKAAVLRVLQSGAGKGVERSLLLALNVVPEASPPIFRRDGHPYALEAAPGLTVFVRGAIDDEEARQSLEAFLKSPDQELRLTAARVLRDSVAFSSTRRAMRERLTDREQDEEVRAEVAAALGHWSTLQELHLEERTAVVDQLFGALGESGELVRFRLLSPMARLPLEEEEVSRLRSMAMSAREEEVRRSAAELVGRRMVGGEEERIESVELLAELVVKDPSASVRETGALWLGHADESTEAVSALRHAATLDKDPEVRAAAVTALARFSGLTEVRATILQAGEKDPDLMVRASAKRALAGSGGGGEWLREK